MRAPVKRRGRRAAPAALLAQLPAHVQIEAQPDGNSIARFEGDCVGLATLGALAAERAQDLREGLPLGSFVSADRIIDAELHRLVRRLAGHGLIEYRYERIDRQVNDATSPIRFSVVRVGGGTRL